MRLVTFGQDLLKILTVVTAIAQVSEPVVDLSVPGIAQVYNLSAQEGASLITAFLGSESSTAAAPSAASTIAPALPAPATPPADPAPAEVTAGAVTVQVPTPLQAATSEPGPGLHNVVPA